MACGLSLSPSVGRATTALAISSMRAARAAVSAAGPSTLRQKVLTGLATRIAVAARPRLLVLAATTLRLKAICPSGGRRRGPVTGRASVVEVLPIAGRSAATMPRSMPAVSTGASPAITSISSSANPVPSPA